MPAEKTRAVSSAVFWVPGTVLTGASLAAATVTVMASLSVRVPSLVRTVRVALPLKLRVGRKLAPFNAVLMAAWVPEKVMTASAVPSPVVKVRPARLARVVVPLAPVRVTVRLPPSTSVTLMGLALPAEKTRAVSSAVFWVPGTVLTGLLLSTQVEVQPSPLMVLPSSQLSPASMMLLPQVFRDSQALGTSVRSQMPVMQSRSRWHTH